MGCDSLSAGEWINYSGDDSVLDHVFVPISPQNLPFGLPFATHAEPFWVHFWNCLVGDCSQHDRLFCCITREFYPSLSCGIY